MQKEELIGVFDEIINIFNDINRVIELGDAYRGMIYNSNKKISNNNKYMQEYENFKPELTKQQQDILSNKEMHVGLSILFCILVMGIIPILVGIYTVLKFGNFILGWCFGFFVLGFAIGIPYRFILNKIDEHKKKDINKLINIKISEYQNSNKERYIKVKKEIEYSLDYINAISEKFSQTKDYINSKQDEVYKYDYIVPRKYLNNKAIKEFRDYIYYGRAFTIGECINIYEPIQMHEENLKFKQEELHVKQSMHEDELYQQQLKYEEELQCQNEMNKNMNDIAKSNEIIINQNKEKIKFEKKKYQEELSEKYRHEQEALRQELAQKGRIY